MSEAAARRAVHAYFMQRAIELARRGWYTTRPNPRVGCVLVRDEAVIGEGWHERAGEAHAEQRALAAARAAGADLEGASAYVTLEPCSHTGRTGPCVEALIEAGIARVVIGSGDPNPQVNGRGIARLESAGIEVVTGVLASACEALNPGFNRRMRDSRPFVRLKLAMSLDGRTAMASGESQWITGERARDDVHRLRAEAGAVLTGRGTLFADDPALTVRLPGDWLQPLRVVLDSALQIGLDARVLTDGGATRIYTHSGDSARIQAIEAAGASVVAVAARGAGLDLQAVLADLAEQQINDVLVECGPTLAGALMGAGYVDALTVYMAPRLLGSAARGLLDLAGLERLADAPRLKIESIEPVGEDWRISAVPQPGEHEPSAASNKES